MEYIYILGLVKWWFVVGFVSSALIFYYDWHRGSEYTFFELITLLLVGTLFGLLTLLYGFMETLSGLLKFISPLNFKIKGRKQS